MHFDMAVNPIVTRKNKLGRYEILHELGRGGLGVVYAALDQSTGAVIALKTLDPALSANRNANFAEFFRKGGHSTWRLRHRNIIEILDAGEVEGIAYVAMELLEGESLRKMLDGPLSIARAIQIADEVACGLAYAHEQGVVHRGVKPSNVIVLRSGGVKITDFGIGQLGEAAMLSAQRVGCVNYMSPEQVRGEPVDGRSDIFSLGAVLYEMLTRRPAFHGESPKEVMAKILRAEPPLPSDVNPHVPRLLDGMVLGMLAVHPDDRLPGVRILVRNLQRLEQELGLGQRAAADTDELKTPGADQWRDRDVLQRDEKEPVAPEPPDPNRFSSAPIHDGDLRFRLDSPSAGQFQFRNLRLDGEAFNNRETTFMMDRQSAAERSSGSRPTILAALALVIAVLAIGLTVVLHYAPGLIERLIAASGMQQAPAPAPAVPHPAAPPDVAEAPMKPPIAPAEPQALPPRAVDDERAQPESAEQESLGSVSAPAPTAAAAPQASPPRPVDEERAEPESAGQESLGSVSASMATPAIPLAAERTPSAQKRPRPTQPTANVPQQQPDGVATLIIAVAPQGEIYIDGKHYGTTPPIATLELEPGVRRIEVRSGSRKPYLTYMTVQAGEVRRIQHDFGAKPSNPPPP